MARYTSAYSQFIRRMDEIDLIRSVAREIEKKGPTRPNLETTRGLCRGGIVLLCSHIEGYIEDLATLGLNNLADNHVPKSAIESLFKYHLSRDLIAQISDSNDPQRIAERVDGFLLRDGHIWDSSPSFSPPLPVDEFVGRFSTPTHDNIRRFLGRFGYLTFSRDLAVQLKANMPICTNMVDQVVDRRNKIAHGDLLAFGTPNDLEEMSRLIRIYCRHTDQVVGNWFKSVGCIIRN